MALPLSIIVCAHNPRPEYFDRTLMALRKQTLDQNKWELLVVDNGSAKPLADAWDLSWHPNSRHLQEERPGLTSARLCGIREAQGELLIFVDDDNLLADDYLYSALQIANRHSDIGAFGGQIRPEFESEPPAWTRPYWEMLAIREFPRDLWANFPTLTCTPCGAGMCLRMMIARRYAEVITSDPHRQALGRNGQQLVSYEDIDLAWCACDLGMGIGQFTTLVLTHLIPARRLEKAYLLELAESVHYSSHLLAFSREGRVPNRSRRARLADVVRTWFLPRTSAEFRRAAARGQLRATAALSAAGKL